MLSRASPRLHSAFFHLPAFSFSSSSIQIPRIDVSTFQQGTQPSSQQAAELRYACTKLGFFHVVGHNFNKEKRSNIFRASEEFFDLDSNVKRAIPIKSGGFTRGYVGVGGESGSDLFELKEGFSYGYPWQGAPQNPLQGPNEWPSAAAKLKPEWRHDMEEFYTDMIQVAEATTRALSASLGRDMNYFEKFCDKGDTISLMRFFNYLPQALAEKVTNQTNLTGSSPHTDWGFLTLIVQDQTGGLQVHIDGEWKDIVPCPDGVLVNCGDYLSLATAGQYKSPLHRVVLHPTQYRKSMVLFYYPNYEAELPTAAPGNLSLFTQQAPKHRQQPIDAKQLPFGEFILKKWSEVFRDVN